MQHESGNAIGLDAGRVAGAIVAIRMGTEPGCRCAEERAILFAVWVQIAALQHSSSARQRESLLQTKGACDEN